MGKIIIEHCGSSDDIIPDELLNTIRENIDVKTKIHGIPDTSMIEDPSFKTSKRFIRFVDENITKLAIYIKSHWIPEDHTNLNIGDKQLVMKFYKDMLMLAFQEEHYNILNNAVETDHDEYNLEKMCFSQNPFRLCDTIISPIWYMDTMITDTLARKAHAEMFEYIEKSINSDAENQYSDTKFNELIEKIFQKIAPSQFAFIPESLWKCMNQNEVMDDIFTECIVSESYRLVRNNVIKQPNISDSSWLTESRLKTDNDIYAFMIDLGARLRTSVEEETFVQLSITENDSVMFNLIKDVPVSVQKRIFTNIVNNYTSDDKNDPVVKLKNYADVFNSGNKDAVISAMIRLSGKEKPDTEAFIKKVLEPASNILQSKFYDIFYSAEKKQLYADMLNARKKKRYADLEAIDDTGSAALRVMKDMYMTNKDLSKKIDAQNQIIEELTHKLEESENQNKITNIDTSEAIDTAVNKALIKQSKENKKHEQKFNKAIKNLERNNKHLTEKYEQLQEYTDLLIKAAEIEATQTDDITIDLPEEIRNKRIVFIRDQEHADYLIMQQLADYFPNARFSNGIASEASNKSTDMVILLTKYTCHGTYWSARDKSRSKKVPTLHCAWSRLENIKKTINDYWSNKEAK